MQNQQTKCFDADLLLGFLHERLDPESERAIRDHLDDCERCRKSLDGLVAHSGAWNDARKLSEDPPSVTSGSASGRSDSGRSTSEQSVSGRSTSEQSASEEGAATRYFDYSADATPIGDRDLEWERLRDSLGPTDDPQMLGRLGRYEICGLIGRGSAGIVMKALDPGLGRYVAIKALAPSFASSGSARQRFDREGRAVAAVAHEHVVPVYAVEEYQGLPYIVMQYVPGGSLHRLVSEEGPLDTCEVVRLGMQIARGLSAAHAQGIVHRDVKPANVLQESRAGRTMVTDFGLARVVDDAAMTGSGMIAGTPQYMSPEQAQGERVDARSDLFSLGSVLYTACTGRAPFRSDTVFGVLKRLCDHEAESIREINPSIDAWLVAFIERLHAKDPDLRFESANEVANLLAAELAHLQNPNHHTKPERSWYVKRKPRTQKRWVASAAAVLVSMFTVGVFASESFRAAVGADEWFGPTQLDSSPGNTARALAGLGFGSGDEKPDAKADAGNGGADKTSDDPADGGKGGADKPGGGKDDPPDLKRPPSGVAPAAAAWIVGTDDDQTADRSGDADIRESGGENAPDTVGRADGFGADASVDEVRGVPGELVSVYKPFGEIVDGYNLYLPRSYTTDAERYPLIVFLTGGCGVGGPIEDLACWGIPELINDKRKRKVKTRLDELLLDTFIVVSPHMIGGEFEERQFFDQEAAIEAIIEETAVAYQVDRERIYLTGAGRGGHGTWGLASRRPERYAAVAPLRGWFHGIVDWPALSTVPIWTGYNTRDEPEIEEVDAAIARVAEESGAPFLVLDELKAVDQDLSEQTKIFTRIDDPKDESFPNLYERPEFYDWLLQYKRAIPLEQSSSRESPFQESSF